MGRRPGSALLHVHAPARRCGSTTASRYESRTSSRRSGCFSRRASAGPRACRPWRDVRVEVPADGQVRLLLPRAGRDLPRRRARSASSPSAGCARSEGRTRATARSTRLRSARARSVSRRPIALEIQLDAADTYHGPSAVPTARGDSASWRTIARSRSALRRARSARRAWLDPGTSAVKMARTAVHRPSIAGRLTTLVLNTRAAPLDQQLPCAARSRWRSIARR